MDAKQIIQKAHVYIMRDPKYALFAGVLLCGKVEISDSVPAAATNGYDVKYNPDFISTLTEQEVRGVVLHENMHKAFKHLFIWKNLYEQDARRANMACDYVINLMIHKSDPQGVNVSLPKGGLLDTKYEGMDTKKVFDLLGEGGEGGEGGGEGGGFDSHEWGEGDEPVLTDAQVKELDEAIRQGVMNEKLRGGGEGCGMRELGELLAPKIKWEDELMEFVLNTTKGTDASSWRKPSRRWVYQDVYMPSSISESIGPLVIAVDTSGSISNDEVTRFLSEISYICRVANPEAVDLIYWGSKVVGHETYLPDTYETLASSTKVTDGGGTEILCVPAYIKNKKLNPCAVIVLTDGFVGDDWGTYDCPVLFAVTTEGVTASTGKTLRLEV